ncbi:MAG: NAD-dependent epimerase/dehydratase family protein [Dehalococcoidia bacterium]
MRILLTGATGFIGGHLLQALVEQNHETFSLERYVTGRYILGAERRVKSVFCDLRDNVAVRRVVREIQPDAVVHLASISPVAYSYDRPSEVIEANLMGTVNLAEACLREVSHLGQFLFASTSETYGNGPLPKTEDTPQCPNSPYAVSKLAAERYMLYMRDAYEFPATVLRPFNTYGRKDNTHFVVERTVVQMLRGDTVRLGDSSPVRDLLYIDDHVGAYLNCLGREQATGEVFNFCTGRGISVRELVDMLREITGFQGEVLWDTIPGRPLDIRELIGNYDKAERVLGWQPKVSLEEGLSRAVDYWGPKLNEALKQ